MRTRNAANLKSPTPKKTPPGKKSAVKATATSAEVGSESSTPKTSETKRSPATRGRPIKKNQTTPLTDSKLEQPSGTEDDEASPGACHVTTTSKVGRVTKSVANRTTGKTNTPTLSKCISPQGSDIRESGEANVEESKYEVGEAPVVRFTEKEPSPPTVAIETQVVESMNEEPSQPTVVIETQVVEPMSEEPSQPTVVIEAQVVESMNEEPRQLTAESTLEEPVKEDGHAEENEEPVTENVGECTLNEQNTMELVTISSDSESSADTLEQKEPSGKEVTAVLNKVASCGVMDELEGSVNQEKSRDGGVKEKLDVGPSNMEEIDKEDLQLEDNEPMKEVDRDEMEYGEKVDLGENGNEEHREDDVDVDDHSEETKKKEEEQRELAAIVKERKRRKEREVFVGGLDRDAAEEDVRKVFEKIGEIVEIRLHKNLSTHKNKGYAFVEYAKKEHAMRALSEMKNPVIHGKRCGTAPSEDNDTLFLGNICNTWTKEAISQKLKEYGIEGVENITLVADVQREGLSRGFAFIEFSCHAEAMFAYKRLQKPDVVFGHLERSAKVAFAEPLREPDPDVMAQVKSIFVDGLPPQWDEHQVREQLKGYGEIVRVCLARNMSTAKRKDFGFVDFSTHEAAVACVDGVNNAELYDGDSKVKVKARLSNPMPKTQAVKGGMCGGFRIGHGDGYFPKSGRGNGRGGNSSNNANFRRGFHHGGRGHMGRMNFPNEYGFDNPHAEFHGRQNVGRGGRRGSFRSGDYPSGRFAGRNFDRSWHGVPNREREMHYPPMRQPYSPEGHFDRPFPGNHFDDPYGYNDSMRGMKRPLYTRDPDPDFVEPSRIRPRLEYSDPAASFRGSRYHDTNGAGSSVYPRDYYGPDNAGGPYSSYYGGDPPYGGGYYY